MSNNYQLIHIDTLESVMCEKITIEGKDYYVIKTDDLDMFTYYVDIIENTIEFEGDSDEIDINPNWRKLIATTNTSLQCPQVVDYLEYIGRNEWFGDSEIHTIGRQSFIEGYQKHSETHSLSDEEVVKFAWWFINNPQTSGGKITETIQQFKSTLPIKVYYR